MAKRVPQPAWERLRSQQESSLRTQPEQSRLLAKRQGAEPVAAGLQEPSALTPQVSWQNHPKAALRQECLQLYQTPQAQEHLERCPTAEPGQRQASALRVL